MKGKQPPEPTSAEQTLATRITDASQVVQEAVEATRKSSSSLIIAKEQLKNAEGRAGQVGEVEEKARMQYTKAAAVTAAARSGVAKKKYAEQEAPLRLAADAAKSDLGSAQAEVDKVKSRVGSAQERMQDAERKEHVAKDARAVLEEELRVAREAADQAQVAKGQAAAALSAETTEGKARAARIARSLEAQASRGAQEVLAAKDAQVVEHLVTHSSKKEDHVANSKCATRKGKEGLFYSSLIPATERARKKKAYILMGQGVQPPASQQVQRSRMVPNAVIQADSRVFVQTQSRMAKLSVKPTVTGAAGNRSRSPKKKKRKGRRRPGKKTSPMRSSNAAVRV